MARVHRLLSCLLVLSACVPPRPGREPAPVDRGRILEHVAVLADDSMRGRATPSRELDLAAAYVAHQLASYGVRPAFDDYITRYRVLELARDRSATRLRRADGDAVGLGRSLLTRAGSTLPLGIHAPLVILAGDPATARGITLEQVKGRIALVVLPEPRTGITSAFWTMLRNLPTSAEAYLIVSEASDSAWHARLDATLARRFVLPADTGASLPLLEIRIDAAQHLLGEAFDLRAALDSSTATFTATSLDDVVVELAAPLIVTGVHEAPNVAGVIGGDEPGHAGEYVVLSAHLDHLGVAADGAVYNGADDNASGVATLLEVARAAAARRSPMRPILFLFPSGEEMDLWGSRAFVARLQEAGAAPIANLNLDMIGRNAADIVHLVGEPHSDVSAWVHRAAAGTVPRMHLAGDVWPDADFFSRSDQWAFHEAGIPALFIFAGPHGDYHRVTDDAGALDYAKLERIGRLVLAAATLLAESPTLPAITR
jgi:hypothetical protein